MRGPRARPIAASSSNATVFLERASTARLAFYRMLHCARSVFIAAAALI